MDGLNLLGAWLAGGIMGSFGSFPFLILMMVALFAFMVVPGQRKQKAWAAMLAQLKSGDKVTTTGGIRGTIVNVKDDVLVLRVLPDNVKLEVMKSAIASVTTDEDAAK